MSVTCHGLTGFECGLLSTSGGGIANTTLGSACTVSGSSPRHGTHHLHVATTSSSPSSVTFLHSGTPDKTLCRFGVAIRSLPAATGNARGMLAFSGASGGQWQIFILHTGAVQLYAGGVSQDGPSISDGAYHVIEVQADTSTNPWTLSWIVDGVTQTPVSNPQSAVTVTLFAFGEGALTNNAYTADFDDLILGAWTSTTDWFGDGKVLGYPAASDGTHLTPADFTQGDAGSAFSGATTTANTFVDEVPWSATRSTTDSIGQGTIGTGAYMEIKCATNAETFAVANAVRALIGFSAASATANTAGCIALNSAGASVPIFGDLPVGQGGGGGALANYGSSSNAFKAALVPVPGAGWTSSEVDAVKLRFGGSDDVSPVPTLQVLMLEVDWAAPPTAPMIVFVDAVGEIQLLDPANLPPVAVTSSSPHIWYRPRLRPDGLRIAAISNDQLWLMDFDGGNRVQITNVDPDLAWNALALCWSPDSTQLASIFEDGTHSGITIMNADNSGHSRIVLGASDQHVIEFGSSSGALEWSPDGSMFAYIAANTTTDWEEVRVCVIATVTVSTPVPADGASGWDVHAWYPNKVFTGVLVYALLVTAENFDTGDTSLKKLAIDGTGVWTIYDDATSSVYSGPGASLAPNGEEMILDTTAGFQAALDTPSSSLTMVWPDGGDYLDWGLSYSSPSSPSPSSALAIRESPPMRLSIDVETADHRHFRWAGDERDPANVPSGLQFSSTMPGGFESLSCVLPRKSNLDYSDLEEYATITASGFAGTVAGQGRLSTQPRTSGDQMAVTPAALGWQTHLDDQQVRAIYLDMDQSKWTDMPGTRLDAVSAFAWVQNASEQIIGSPSGGPAMRTSVTGDVSTTNVSEAWYDSLGIPIAGLFYGWYRGATITPLTHWQWTAWLLDDPVTFGDGGTGLAATGPDSGYVPATVPTRRNAMVQLSWNDGSGLTADVAYPIDWTVLSVVGNHGLTLNGGDENVAPTLLASDIVGHAISAWCPKFTGNIHIDRGGYYISQLAFTDAPVPVSEIIRQCARFLLEDWAVWEGPSFWWTARGARARKWQARAGPAQLQETGPDATQLFNEVIVSYQDVDGTTLTVGPPGSLVNIEDASLRDDDPQNPVTAAGLTRRTLLSMGTGVSGDAIFIGRAFLVEQKFVNHAGQATLTGIVQDAGGVLWPAWMVRAGDEISFTDAADTSPRRIVQASYDHDSRTCQVSLDSPPDALSAILERIGAQIATVGFA